MTWLQKNMEHHLAMKLENDDAELLTVAAKILSRSQEGAAEVGANAQKIVSHAQQELKIVERLLHESEAARRLIELELKKVESKRNEAESIYEARIALLEQEKS